MEVTLSEFANQYILERDLARTTEYQLRYTITHFQKTLGQELSLSDVTTDHVNQYLRELQKSGNAGDTQRTRRTNLLAILNEAFRQKLTDFDNRRVRRVKIARRIVEAWTRDDVQKLIDVAATWTGNKLSNGADEGAYWQAYIATGWDSGLRHGDIMALPMSTISERFWWTQQKTGLPVLVDLHYSTVELIERLMRTGEKRDCPFEWPYERRAFFKHAARLIKEAGLTGSLKYLRRSCATSIAAQSQDVADASRKLGHTSQGITLRHYLSPEWQDHPVNLPPELGRGPSAPQKPEAAPSKPKSDIPLIVRPTVETTLEDFAEAYIRGRVFKPSTERYIRETVRKFQKLTGGSIPVSDLQADKVTEYLTAMEENGAAPGSIGPRKSAIVSLWKEAHALGLNAHPVDNLPEFTPKPRTEARWTLEEVQRLHATAANWGGDPRQWALFGLYWSTFTAVAWDTGLKREDILRLRRKEIATTMEVYRKRAGYCRVHLHPSTVEAVQELADAQGGQRPPLRWMRSEQTCWNEAAQLIKAAGLTGTFRNLVRDIDTESPLPPALVECEVVQ